MIVGEEWAFWKHERDTGREPYGCIEDSVVPIVESGLVVLVDATHDLGEGLQFGGERVHRPLPRNARIAGRIPSRFSISTDTTSSRAGKRASRSCRNWPEP